MANAFSPASRSVKPIAYDSGTGVVAIIHRGDPNTYALGSGQLWYNISHNDGATWRRVSELNAGNELAARYPGCAMLNPTNSPDTGDVFFVYAAPMLSPSGAGFGRVIYGVDVPGVGGPYAIQEGDATTEYWSNLPIWTGSTWVHWVCYTGTTVDDYTYWRTDNYGNIPRMVPPTWTVSNFQTNGRDLAGHYRNGTNYFGVWASFPGDPDEVYNLGYSTSVDDGATWSEWTAPGLPSSDWRSLPGIAGTDYRDWWNYGGPGVHSYDMCVDANGYVHFFGVVEDSVTLERAVVEIYETGSGWDSKFIQSDLKESTDLVYPYPAGGGLNQMGNHLNVSMNLSGEVMGLVWLDADLQGEAQPDIWFACRTIDGQWSTPENLTQTPDFHELLLHAAPILKNNGAANYTMYLGRSYEIGSPPIDTVDALNQTIFYAGTYTFDCITTGVGTDETEVPQTFHLSQNYPNPFNPSTIIRYSVPTSSFVTLKVYDVLGRDVSTLVNEEQAPGTYSADFDAVNLSNGTYFYKIQAGSFSDVKKMMLLK
jgi:hypothetical protein